MGAGETAKGILVIGTIGEDIHSAGISILKHALRAAGFKMIYLGVSCAQEEFIRAAIGTNADAILVSSLNGHAKISCSGLREKCVEAGLKDTLLYLGGNLMTDEPPWEQTEKMFKDMGFDRVYPPQTLPETVIVDLKTDLGMKV